MSTLQIYKNDLHLARKYARIFVRRHYLFRKANSFPRAQRGFKNWGISVGYSPVLAGELIQSRDTFRLIARERKYLMNYN